MKQFRLVDNTLGWLAFLIDGKATHIILKFYTIEREGKDELVKKTRKKTLC